MITRTAWLSGKVKSSSPAPTVCTVRRTVPGQKKIAPESVKLLARLPGGGGHNSRTVGVGPDGRVYVSLGIQGNCSDQYLGDDYSFDNRRGGVFVLREEGGQARWEAYGSGLAQSGGFCLASGNQNHVRQQ